MQQTKNNKMKVFYFHVPKTAGSSINKFFSDNISPHISHIEGLDLESDLDIFNRYKFLSGHVSYTKINKLIDLDYWVSIITFRDPLAYTISHLKWVRKLADEGEEERFNSHPKIFQNIATKMLEFDYSQASEITRFIKWLESINFSYFHNTQTLYMNQSINGMDVTSEQLEIACRNIDTINFVGIQEELDSFMSLLRYEMDWEFKSNPRVNINENNYGFNKDDPDTVEALRPLYEKDLILYEYARNRSDILLKRYADVGKKLKTRGKLDLINNHRAKGWVRYEGGNLSKVELEIMSNDQFLGSFYANEFREGIKIKGIHPSGCCGFDVDLSKYSEYPDVYLRLKHNKEVFS